MKSLFNLNIFVYSIGPTPWIDDLSKTYWKVFDNYKYTTKSYFLKMKKIKYIL